MASKNWEKQYKDWYLNTFMKACAAYAVAYDFSWPEGSEKRPCPSWNLKKALEYETSLEIPEQVETPELVNQCKSLPSECPILKLGRACVRG